MRGALFLFCFAGMATGILLTRWATLAALLAAASLLILLIALVWFGGNEIVWFLLFPAAGLLLGSALMIFSLGGINGGMLPELASRGADGVFNGVVSARAHESFGGFSFVMQVRLVESEGARWRVNEKALVRVEDRRSGPEVTPGTRVEVEGRVCGVSEQNRSWLLEQGASAVIGTGSGNVRIEGTADFFSRMVNGLRDTLSSLYEDSLERRAAGLVKGVTLGNTEGLDGTWRSRLSDCGLEHIVAVSGLHVGAAAMIVGLLATLMGAGRRSRSVLVVLGMVLVVLLADFRTSALRAFIMAAFCLGGYLIGRTADSLAGLSLAGIIILANNPLSMFDVGFQFSFAAALAIVLALRNMSKRKGAGTYLVVCAAAQLGIMPLVLLRARSVPVVALIANLIIVPMVAPLLLAGWALAAVSLAGKTAVKLVALVPDAISRAMMAVASFLSRVPPAGIEGGTITVISLIVYAVGLVLIIRRARAGRGLLAPAVAIGVAIVLAMLPVLVPLPEGSKGSVTFFDVGQGDSILVRDCGGSNVLVDGGPSLDGVARKLASMGIGKIDVMVLTHPHHDHLNGLLGVMDKLNVGKILEPGLEETGGPAYREFMKMADLRDVETVTAREGLTITLSEDVRLEVLYAPRDLPAIPEQLNDCSIVMMATIDDARVLLTGDLEIEGQRALIGFHPDLACDVLKVPHQGAADSAFPPFISRAQPRIGIVSVGEENSYGHPSREHLKMLEASGAEIMRTDTEGDIEISVDGDRIRVTR